MFQNNLSDKLSFAFGSEFRMEEFTVYAGDTASYFFLELIHSQALDLAMLVYSHVSTLVGM
jgi:hypothetical protein